MTTRTYRLDHDLGFAPNPFFGWCTLACCMPEIRRNARVDDIVVGMAGRGQLRHVYPRLIYWMRVEETLSFDEYWNDTRFANKRPQIAGPKILAVGDRTYRHDADGADWSFESSMHYVPDELRPNTNHVMRDTKVNRLLVSRCFTYWGGSGPHLPADLIGLFPNPRGQKCKHDPEQLSKLHRLIEVETPRFVVGEPADWENPRYFATGDKSKRKPTKMAAHQFQNSVSTSRRAATASGA